VPQGECQAHRCIETCPYNCIPNAGIHMNCCTMRFITGFCL
jgi:hypothetical protein